MSFAAAVRTCFSKYATFSGRATRSEYWWFGLVFFGTSFVAGVLDGIVGGYPFGLLVFVALTVPFLAVSVRRLHDTGRSGWSLLAYFIPLVGWIFPLVYMLKDSEAEANAHGPNPKADAPGWTSANLPAYYT